MDVWLVHIHACFLAGVLRPLACSFHNACSAPWHELACVSWAHTVCVSGILLFLSVGDGVVMLDLIQCLAPCPPDWSLLLSRVAAIPSQFYKSNQHNSTRIDYKLFERQNETQQQTQTNRSQEILQFCKINKNKTHSNTNAAWTKSMFVPTACVLGILPFCPWVMVLQCWTLISPGIQTSGCGLG